MGELVSPCPHLRASPLARCVASCTHLSRNRHQSESERVEFVATSLTARSTVLKVRSRLVNGARIREPDTRQSQSQNGIDLNRPEGLPASWQLRQVKAQQTDMTARTASDRRAGRTGRFASCSTACFHLSNRLLPLELRAAAT